MTSAATTSVSSAGSRRNSRPSRLASAISCRMPKKMKPSGVGDAGDGRYGERRDGDHGEALPETVPADLPAMGEKQADADQEQEGRGDAARVDLPPAEGGQAGIGIAEEFEIPGEVVARHGDQRDAARDVDGDDALRLMLAAVVRSAVGCSWSRDLIQPLKTTITVAPDKRSRRRLGSRITSERFRPEPESLWPASLFAVNGSVSCYRLRNRQPQI